MEFLENDTEEERALKYAVLDVYNQRLDERLARKNFVLEWNYLDLSKLTLDDKPYTKEERDIIQLLKPLARFHDKKEHYELMENIMNWRLLKKKVAELEYYRGILGTMTLDDLERAEAMKERQDSTYKRRVNMN